MSQRTDAKDLERTPLLAKPEEHLRKGIVVRIVGGVLVMLFCVGIGFGYVALKPALIAHGVFANFCSANEEMPCSSQILKLNMVIEAVSAVTNFLCFILGMGVDHFDNRKFMAICSIIWTGCMVLAGIAFDEPAFYHDFWWLPMVCLCIVSLSGTSFFFMIMKFGYLVPSKYQGQVNALLTASWDLSTSVFLFFNFLYFYGHISIKIIFIGYALIVVIPLLIFSYFIVVPKDETATQGAIQQQDPKEEMSLMKEVKSLKYILVMAFMAFSQLQLTFYWGTFREHAIWINHGVDSSEVELHTTVFSIMLPAMGFGSNFILGIFLKPVKRAILILAAMDAIWGALSCIRYLPIQFVTYPIFVSWRIFSFIVLYGWIIEFYPMSKFGTMSSLALSVGGCTALASYGLNVLVVKIGENFLPINLALTVITVVVTVALSIATPHPQKKD